MSQQKENKNVKKLIASKVIDGGLAGVTGVSATFPLDLAKTRLQNQVIQKGQAPKYKNLFHAVKVVGQQEGIKGLYSGYSVNVGFIVFEKAIKLVCNDVFRMILADPETGDVSLTNSCIAGASAGAAQSIVTTPMELLKIKGQEAGSRGESFNVFKSFKTIMQAEGATGFYRGWCSTLVRDVPFSFLYFPLYAELHYMDAFGGGNSFQGNLCAGMISGAVAGGLSTPTDVIKTRLQNLPPGSGKMSWMECAKLVGQEGTSAFFKGAGPRMICIGSLFAVAQGFYELGTGNRVLTAAGWD